MPPFHIFKAKSNNDLERCYPVMKELRKTLSYDDFIEIYKAAQESDQYEILALETEGQIGAVMGYRILFDFVHGKHLYIDDLVTSESFRSKGFGAMLLSRAEIMAKELGCKGLRLCTGIENELGKKFYEKQGWSLRAVAYKKKLG